MVRIRHKELGSIAETHTNALLCYLRNRANKKRVSEVFEQVGSFLPGFEIGLVLRAEPDELSKLAREWKHNVNDRGLKLEDFSSYKKSETTTLNSEEEAIKSICTYFNTLYTYLGESEKYETKYSANKIGPYNSRYLLNLLKIKVCPYCNRNYIYNAGDHRASELDHFFPKSCYPFLALSFYNLIPSCKVCNNIKGTSELLYNPYSDSNLPERIKFKLKIKGAGFYHRPEDFRLYAGGDYLDRGDVEKIRNHIKVLRLFEQYNGHKDIVLELIQKSHTYNDSYVDELFRQYEGTLFKNREDVLRHVYGNYVDPADDHKRPLAKLVRDITEDLEG